jgi:hypothetical protein
MINEGMIDPGNGEDLRSATADEIARATAMWERALSKRDKTVTIGERLCEVAIHLCALATEHYPSRHLRDHECAADYAEAVGYLTIASEATTDIDNGQPFSGEAFRRYARVMAAARSRSETYGGSGGLRAWAADVAVLAMEDAERPDIANRLAVLTLAGLGAPVVEAYAAQARRAR